MKAGFLLWLLAIPASHAWSIVYYSEQECNGEAIGYDNFSTEDATCRQPAPQISARSARVSGISDDFHRFGTSRKAFRFYDIDNCFSICGHRHVIGEMKFDECVSWNHAPRMLSYQIVELGALGYGEGALSDGHCALKHGPPCSLKVVNGGCNKSPQPFSSRYLPKNGMMLCT